ncbi:hypothetical protein Q31b_13100 [Novipirellula aureliae]|uniref:Uncharacterized protein n=1 Tax=Novipirellula aureliae TaxID=2527966 RepID=A0A5C6E4E4_9BACT|nr:hypothetical protein Q31b_13100 [Novipirellula aureliae]
MGGAGYMDYPNKTGFSECQIRPPRNRLLLGAMAIQATSRCRLNQWWAEPI